jgi:hypothetical protein
MSAVSWGMRREGIIQTGVSGIRVCGVSKVAADGLAIADCERLGAKSSPMGKGIKTPESSKLTQMTSDQENAQGTLHAGNAPLAYCSVCGRELNFFEGGTPICGGARAGVPKATGRELPKATEDDKEDDKEEGRRT